MQPRGSPSRMLLLACLGVMVGNALLLGGAAARRGARIALEATADNLRENLATLAGLRNERHTQLEAALVEAQTRLEAAQAALPPDVARPDLFRLGYALASDTPVLVLSLHRLEGEVRETPLGPVAISTHRIVAEGGLEACLGYMASFEGLGAGLRLAGVLIRPAESECSFDVRSLSRGP